MRLWLPAILILFSAAGWAQEPVLRLVDMKAEAARPLVEHRKASDKGWFPAFVGSEGAIHDHFKTDARTVAALEFYIGGRVGVSPNTDIEIVSERSVSDVDPPVQRVILRDGTLWLKSSRKLTRPLEIQTNGGTMGIKGTEFTLEAHPDGEVKLAVLHGTVEVKDDSQKFLGVAVAGDVYELKKGQEPVHKTFSLEEIQARTRDILKATRLDSVAFSMDEDGGLARAQQAIGEVRNDQQQVGNSLKDLTDKLNAMHTRGDDGFYLAAPYQDAIRAGGGPTGGSQLAPTTPAPASVDTLFTWKEYPGADGYVIFLSDKANFTNILFSDRVRGTAVVYPSGARPLARGRYFWRIVPVQADDTVVPGALAGQATFDLKDTR